MSKKWITATMATDLKCYEAFRCCNTLNKDMLNQMGMSDKRVKNHIKDKLIEQKDLFNKKTGESTSVYVPTKSGRDFMAKKMNVSAKNWYRSNSERHDIAVAKMYMKLKDEHKASCLTEGNVRDMMKTHIKGLRNEGQSLLKVGDIRGKELYDRANELDRRLEEEHSISPPDLVYTNSMGQMETIEIVSDAYGNDMIQAKIDFCIELGIEVQLYKI